jgi:phosphatidate cytidylyltransferase
LNEPADETAIAPRDGLSPLPQWRRSTLWREWLPRALFGILLATLAIAADLAGPLYFAAWIFLGAFAAVREWHRLVSGERYALALAASTASIAAGLSAILLAPQSFMPLWLLALGSVLAAAGASMVAAKPGWNAIGPVYVGVPSVSLLALRAEASQGWAVLLLIFLVVWSADTAALLAGRFLGGPKLVPTLSPNKTWSGFVAGCAVPSVAACLYVTLVGGNGWLGALLGLVLALAGHSGDLFESWAKRRVGRKNSGGLIPGHGGVLDRVDSLLFAAPLAAVLVFVFGLDPLFGGRP